MHRSYHRDVYFAFSPGFGFPTPPSASSTTNESTTTTTTRTTAELESQAETSSIPAQQTLLPVQSRTNWHDALVQILETKCALFCTGFSPADVERDVAALDVTEDVRGEYEWVLGAGLNEFRSERWEVAEFDYRVIAQANWGVWGIKGKRYEVQPHVEELVEEGLVPSNSSNEKA